MVGGLFLAPSRSFVGPHAEQMMKTLHADHLFLLGADAIDANGGPSTPDVLAAQLNGAMIRACDEVTIVADASKLGRRSVCSICSFSEIRRIITDTRIDPSTANLLKNQGIELVLA
jgi:DeoR family transcriptional regulator of aga operon